MIKITIVIVSYNVSGVIYSCLENISDKDSEIFLIDNASSDRTVSLVKKTFPKIRILKNKKNLGFAKAANQGAKMAKGEHLLFLNPDTTVETNTIETMMTFLEKRKSALVVGCKIKNPDGSLQFSCGNFPTMMNVIADRIPLVNKTIKTYLIRDEKWYKTSQSPDWITGAFFLTRKKEFLALGGFDESYFMYGEDVDFCYRARKKGYEIYFNPKAAITHLDMGKSNERKHFKAAHMRTGLTLFFQKYMPPWYSRTWRYIVFCEHLLRPRLYSS